MNPEESLAKSLERQPLSDKARHKRRLLAARDGGMRCAYCHQKRPLERLVLEHVVPRSQGGPDMLLNRVLSCAPCDHEKGARTPQEWRPGVVWGNPTIDTPTKKRRGSARPAHAIPQRSIEEAERKGTRKPRMSTAQRDAAIRGSISYCATCRTWVSLKRPHPPWHLLISDDTYERMSVS